MKVFDKTQDLRNFLAPFFNEKSIGFVPTMGALHAGHLSLIEASLKQNQMTIVSIFVNPTQFNNAEDLEKYPRNLQKDIDLIEEISSEIVIFAPSVSDIYGENPKSEEFDFDGIDSVMEGAHRPGHFNGVGTIVKKLFEITSANYAYFGEKDYQQLCIIQKLVEILKLNIKIIPCPTLRESNGLAMSSRNLRLSAEMREKASFIYESLISVRKIFAEKDAQQAKDFIENWYENNPDFTLEYFSIARQDNLQPVEKKEKDTQYRAFIAAYAEGVRLIDNIPL